MQNSNSSCNSALNSSVLAFSVHFIALWSLTDQGLSTYYSYRMYYYFNYLYMVSLFLKKGKRKRKERIKRRMVEVWDKHGVILSVSVSIDPLQWVWLQVSFIFPLPPHPAQTFPFRMPCCVICSCPLCKMKAVLQCWVAEVWIVLFWWNSGACNNSL